MILSSKQCVLITSSENKEFFLFDPKTTSVPHKYRDDCFLSAIAYYSHSQQIIAQQINKTFVSIWNIDSQEGDIKISLNQTMSHLSVSDDSHFLFGGSVSGNLYIWELPSGLLIKKKVTHSSDIKQIIEFSCNHFITVSRNEAKLWPLSSVLIDSDNSTPIKCYTSVLEIISAAESRGILAILTHKSLTFLQLSLQRSSREFQLIHKIDYEYATTLCLSKTSAFVGNTKGEIEVIELMVSEEQKTQLTFRLKEGTKELEINRPKKKRSLNGGSKHPVTALAFVQSLGYLISGHSSGEVTIWNNYEVKKSIHLFKTAISLLQVIPKPKEEKIFQTNKIRPLNKYELSKDQQLLEIVPSLKVEGQERKQLEVSCEQSVLWEMLNAISQPERILRQEVQQLKEERKHLIQANLHYFKLLVQ